MEKQEARGPRNKGISRGKDPDLALQGGKDQGQSTKMRKKRLGQLRSRAVATKALKLRVSGGERPEDPRGQL